MTWISCEKKNMVDVYLTFIFRDWYLHEFLQIDRENFFRKGMHA